MLKWAFWNIFVSLLPVFVLLFLLVMLSLPVQWEKVFANSVLLFFATAICGTSLYRLTSPKPIPPKYQECLPLGLILLVVVSILAIACYTLDVLKEYNLLTPAFKPRSEVLIAVQFIGAAIAAVFSWKVDSL